MAKAEPAWMDFMPGLLLGRTAQNAVRHLWDSVGSSEPQPCRVGLDKHRRYQQLTAEHFGRLADRVPCSAPWDSNGLTDQSASAA